MIERHQTVAAVVLDHSECAEVFQRHRIDFCCRGDMSIEDAAKAKNLDAADLLRELWSAVAERHTESSDDPRNLPTAVLVAQIVSRHHDYLRRALPFIQTLAAKVGRVHGDHNPKLRELDAAVQELADTMMSHIENEEDALFPLLLGEGAERGALQAQLDEMTEEHRTVATMLERVRAAADDFLTPEWACNSYRTLFAELADLERDTFAHVHVENHVLRPRFLVA